MSQIHDKCVVCESVDLYDLPTYQKHYLVSCKNCNMVFSRRIPAQKELDDLYKNYSYSDAVVTSEITIMRYKKLLAAFEKFRLSNRLLDYGCGRGEFLLVAKEMGWEVYGFEYSEKAIDILKIQGIHTIGKNEIDNYFNSSFFDLVISSEVMEHLIDPVSSMQDIFGMLRKGGCFYMTVPNFNSVGRIRLKNSYPVIAYPEHISYFSKKPLAKALRLSGFSRIKIQSTGLNPAYLKKREKTKSISSDVVESFNLENTRVRFDTSLLMRMIKVIINGFLNLFGVGETLKALALKK